MRFGDAALRALLATLLVATVFALSGASAQAVPKIANVNWASFGNTVNQNRYSPLTEINPGNVTGLGRVFTVDLNQFVPGIKKGQETYPVIVNGTMYVTSGDDQVFAVNAATGALLWHYAPSNVKTFQELRNRRQPRRHLLRQHDLPADARHDDRRP